VNTCETCKWWAESTHDERMREGQCSADTEKPGDVPWYRSNRHGGGGVRFQLHGSWSDADGILVTKPDFGCVEWEQKEAK
jgi:hypothetical protein